MKKYIYVLLIGFIPLLFSCCGASKTNEDKKFQKKPPFKIIKATYVNWENEQSGSRGIQVEISMDNAKIVLDTIFFRNMKTSLKKELNAINELYVGTFVLPKKNEFILHGDSKKEYGNMAPDLTINIPFILKKDEAVVSYFYKNKLEFFKIKELLEGESTSISN